MTPTDIQVELGADALIDHVVPFPLEGADTIEMSGMYSYDELKAMSDAVLKPVLDSVEQQIQQLRDEAWIAYRCALPGDVEMMADASARLDAFARCIAIVQGVSDE